MGYVLIEPPSGRIDFGEPVFSEAYLVSARYGECRRVGGKVLSIFQIACGINEALVNCRPEAGITIADRRLADVLEMIPNRRRYTAPDPSTLSSADREAYLTIQPILLIRLENSSLILDGLRRLEFLQEKGSKLVRCVQISEKRASYFGRAGIDVFDDKRRPIELDKKQRTLKGTLPPSIDDRDPYSGRIDDEEIRPALSKRRRDSVPKVREEGQDGRARDIIERDRYLIEDAYLTTLAPHLATVKHRRIQLTMEMTAKDARKLSLDPQDGHQAVLDHDLKVDRNIFKKGNAGKSIHQIVLIRFLLTLFNTIETLHSRIKAAGLIAQQKSSAYNNIYNRRVGHMIVNDDPRYKNAIGSFPNLQEKMKDWRDIAELTAGVYASGLHEGLFEIGLRRCHGPGDHGLTLRENHAYSLLQATLKALRRAHNQTGNLRNHRQHNNGKPPKSNLRADLDQAVDGEPSVRNPEAWDVDRIFRLLLALHARLNPAKIWRDETHLTLMYQWLVVLGDLNRNGSMIVTCHMAQEFFFVHRFRSSGDNPDFNADWSFFDEALSLAVASHPARANVDAELVKLCATAMRTARATRVKLRSDSSACFEPTVLSPETSKLAEAAIWLT